jgi:titin
VNWLAASGTGLATGNSEILSYELLWDVGDSALTDFVLLSNALVTTLTTTGLTEGQYYRFVVRAVNIYGAGPDSPVANIRASDVPSLMAAVVTTRVGLDLVATFVEPAANGAAIEEYEIQLYSPKDGVYVEDTTYCDGAQTSIQTSKACTFTFLYLKSEYLYNTGDLALFRGRARNADGWGGYSTPNSVGATVMTVPAQMSAPTEGAATSATQIEIAWTALTSTDDIGGTPITSYQLDWDQNTTTWVALVGEPSSPYTYLSYTYSAGVVAGLTYNFRVRAHNALGEGPTSSLLTVIPSSPPAKMDAVVTGPLSIFTQWTWTAPDDRGAALTAYGLYVEASDGSLLEETVYCPSSESSLLTNRYCNIPMAVLAAAPYSLPKGTLIRVKIQAQNLKGWSELSEFNTAGSVLETVPVAPGTPRRVHASTDDT